MNKTKKWYQSKTIWGIVFSALAFIAGRYVGVQPEDISVPPNADFDQLRQIAAQVQAAKNNTADLITAIVGALGALYAIYNRIVTTAKITSTPTTPNSKTNKF